MIIGSCVKDRVYVMLREGLSPVWLPTWIAHLPFNWYVVDWHTLSISDWPNYWDPLSCVCPSTDWLTRCGLALKTEWACNTRRISSKIKAEPTDNNRITLASRKVIRITTALHYHHSISPSPSVLAIFVGLVLQMCNVPRMSLWSMTTEECTLISGH